MDPMNNERYRLESFKHPNWTCRLMDSGKLSNSGFYYTGHQDYVRCAFCKVQIGHWQQGDDCERDHQRWSFGRCPFLRGVDVCNIPLNGPASPLSVSSNVKNHNSVMGRIGINVRPSYNTSYAHGPLYKSFSTIESRLDTFDEWPRVMRLKPQLMAGAGFFYTGHSDHTRCFYYGLALKDWGDTDDPWEQHARWSTHCVHVRLNKNDEYIRQVCSEEPPVLLRNDAIELLKNSLDTFTTQQQQ